MGKLFAFPSLVAGSAGTVHAYPMEGGGFEVGHESSSGNSWGSFEEFACPQAAVAAAYRLNRETYGGACDVHLSPALVAALPQTPAPDGEEF